MTDLLAPTATYDDPTIVHFEQDAIALVGREAIVEFWRKSSEEIGARNIDYEITRCFESGGITVLTMTLSITVITNRSEGIVAVVDYFDYAGSWNSNPD